ncbi:MAG: NAD-dependent epimerase/dehydratase family protein [Aphanocapsa lilacina HA4352-LM1]|nr:NAD-dependent epimerase/dehydratase family protein [Aphanocapsa lilacina HA4352-LM1]
MRAFVTGGTGLLGSNLVRLLVEGRHGVRVLARDPERARRVLGDLPVAVVAGDLAEVDGFAGHLAGCDVLFHAAAYFREYFQPGDHWQRLERLNVRSTVALLKAAERRGVQKAIYVSSSGVIGPRPDGQPADESDLPGALALDNLYFRSKVLAEAEVYRFLAHHDLSVTLILPGWMFGPGDSAPTESGQLVLDFVEGKLPGVLEIPGSVSIADARDVALAMLQAVEHGRSGGRYIVSGESYDFVQLMESLARVSGLPAPALRIPYSAGLALAWVSQNFAKLSGGKTVLTTSGLRTLADSVRLDSGKAQRELGFVARPLEETLRDEVAWFRAQGLVAATR